jgi:hypothetical protein
MATNKGIVITGIGSIRVFVNENGRFKRRKKFAS